MFINLIKNFCSMDDNYTFYENYSGRCMFGRTCPAIIVKNGITCTDALVALTAYLKEVEYNDDQLNLDGTSVDSLGLDSVVYFPNYKKNERYTG